MAQRKTLTLEQVELLQWVADGCPAGVVEGMAHRISAAALKRRGLIDVFGSRDSWEASITEAGRAYLKRAKGPDAPLPRQGNKSVTEELVKLVIDAGGTVKLPAGEGASKVDYRARADAAMRRGKVPQGKRLDVRRDWRENVWEVTLVDAPRVRRDDGLKEFSYGDLEPVSVPQRVSRYHAAVRQLRDTEKHHEVPRASLKRALVILNALAVEAERRGYQVEFVRGAREPIGGPLWTGGRDGHISISKGSRYFAFRMSDPGLPSRQWWETQQGSRRRSAAGGAAMYEEMGLKPRPSELLPDYETKATGRLSLTYVGGLRGGISSHWVDQDGLRLEDQLAEVLAEIEMRCEQAEIDQAAAEAEAQRRRAAEEAERERAEREFLEDRRGRLLIAEANAWRDAASVRAYCDAVEAKWQKGKEGKGVKEWISWGREYADSIDPLLKPPSIPPDPTYISAQDLRPFLRRMPSSFPVGSHYPNSMLE